MQVCVLKSLRALGCPKPGVIYPWLGQSVTSLTVLRIGVSYLLLRTAIKHAEKHPCPKKPGLDPMLRTVGDVTDCPKPGVIHPWLRTVGDKQTWEI